ncbi:MAG: mechanosensitive ion channel family protein [Chloroflexi bacterium]|nr:mechanosensitive ion channel family protein [Chloroflexota bacterium]
MLPPFAFGSPLLEVLWADGVLVAFALIAWLVRFAMGYFRRRLEKRPRAARVPQLLLRCLSGPIFLLIIFQGIILSLSSLSYLEPWRYYLGRVAVTLAIIFVTYGLARSLQLLLDWYLHHVKVRQSLSRLVQRITLLFVYLVGLLILLDYLGIPISPLIAGLGIGGLAVALALQPTLTNFFAGTQIVSDRLVHVGDYIELDGGAAGYVVDIGWRSTRIRTTFNNLMIIPNSRMVDSIITNYHGPSMELAVIVESGVSYSSDLTQVEEVSLAVAREVIEELPEAVKTREPWFGFDEFGDSNINFWVWLYARDRISSFRVKSELIKRLHARFVREGITINYPVRMLTYEDSKSKKHPFPPEMPPAD